MRGAIWKSCSSRGSRAIGSRAPRWMTFCLRARAGMREKPLRSVGLRYAQPNTGCVAWKTAQPFPPEELLPDVPSPQPSPGRRGGCPSKRLGLTVQTGRDPLSPGYPLAQSHPLSPWERAGVREKPRRSVGLRCVQPNLQGRQSAPAEAVAWKTAQPFPPKELLPGVPSPQPSPGGRGGCPSERSCAAPKADSRFIVARLSASAEPPPLLGRGLG